MSYIESKPQFTEALFCISMCNVRVYFSQGNSNLLHGSFTLMCSTTACLLFCEVEHRNVLDMTQITSMEELKEDLQETGLYRLCVALMFNRVYLFICAFRRSQDT